MPPPTTFQVVRCANDKWCHFNSQAVCDSLGHLGKSFVTLKDILLQRCGEATPPKERKRSGFLQLFIFFYLHSPEYLKICYWRIIDLQCLLLSCPHLPLPTFVFRRKVSGILGLAGQKYLSINQFTDHLNLIFWVSQIFGYHREGCFCELLS